MQYPLNVRGVTFPVTFPMSLWSCDDTSGDNDELGPIYKNKGTIIGLDKQKKISLKL